jgi:hypothetical protein
MKKKPGKKFKVGLFWTVHILKFKLNKMDQFLKERYLKLFVQFRMTPPF